jgi:hypothetical protein
LDADAVTRNATITEPFADADYVFRMAWGEVVQLQELRDCGPYVVLDRLVTGRWLIQDIREVVRLGLIGGGLKPVEAVKLVRQYIEARPVVESLELATRILQAALVGAPEEPVGTVAGKDTEKIDDLPNGKLRFAKIYGAGAAMGFTPQQVDQMTVWQFFAAVDGFVKANGGAADSTLSETEKDEIWDWMQARAGSPTTLTPQ